MTAAATLATLCVRDLIAFLQERGSATHVKKILRYWRTTLPHLEEGDKAEDAVESLLGNECGDLSSTDYILIWNFPSTKRKKAYQLDKGSRWSDENFRNGNVGLTLLLGRELRPGSEIQQRLFASLNVGNHCQSLRRRSGPGMHLKRLALLRMDKMNLHATAENASRRRPHPARHPPNQSAG